MCIGALMPFILDIKNLLVFQSFSMPPVCNSDINRLLCFFKILNDIHAGGVKISLAVVGSKYSRGPLKNSEFRKMWVLNSASQLRKHVNINYSNINYT